MDNLTIASLRDALRYNTDINRKLRNELHIANLLKLLELGLITKDEIMSDSTYLEYSNKICSNSKTKKKSL